jgi:hypothetical protein
MDPCEGLSALTDPVRSAPYVAEAGTLDGCDYWPTLT